MHEPHTREVRSSKPMLLFYAILGFRVGRFNAWASQGKWGVPNLYILYAILGLGMGDSMHELHKGSEEFQIYVFYAILRLGLGDSMHELHKGSEEFQIYVVVYAILGLGLGDSIVRAPQGKWGVPNLWDIFLYFQCAPNVFTYTSRWRFCAHWKNVSWGKTSGSAYSGNFMKSVKWL